MKFGSKHTAFRVDVRGPEPKLHPATGAIVGIEKPLSAEFAFHGGEYIPRDEAGDPIYRDEQGDPYVTADIRGNFFDSERAQSENGWTDDERVAVEEAVLYHCRTQPRLVWRLEDPVLTAPWPTFDDQKDANVVAFAIEGGMASEALAYARQQKRDKVVAELESYLAERKAEQDAAEALTAV